MTIPLNVPEGWEITEKTGGLGPWVEYQLLGPNGEDHLYRIAFQDQEKYKDLPRLVQEWVDKSTQKEEE